MGTAMSGIKLLRRWLPVAPLAMTINASARRHNIGAALLSPSICADAHPSTLPAAGGVPFISPMSSAINADADAIGIVQTKSVQPRLPSSSGAQYLCAIPALLSFGIPCCCCSLPYHSVHCHARLVSYPFALRV